MIAEECAYKGGAVGVHNYLKGRHNPIDVDIFYKPLLTNS
jgi:hypothetical protein